jgi:hypothetical protein
MRRTALLISLLVWLGCPTVSQAQIDSGRRIDWSNVGIPGGIPGRSTVCATFSPGATAAQINSAIAACSNGVVMLNAGTYTLSAGLDFAGKSNVTLRGAGPDQTVLVFTGSVGCVGFAASICVRNSTGIWTGGVPSSNTASWTDGYAKGTTQITLNNTAGLSVGSIIILDQRNDTTDTGGVFVCDTPGPCATDTFAPGRADGDGVRRSQQQFVRVTGISGSSVSISPGLYMPNWRASQAPQAWWTGPQAAMNGIENLALDHTNGGQTAGILFFNAYQSWVKNVRSLSANRNHVWLYQSAGIVVRDSYVYGTRNASSLSYGVESFMSSDCLVENNIFQHVTTPLMVGNSSGSVFAYNFSIDNYYTVATWMMPAIFGHDAGTGMNLFEGNQMTGYIEDDIHGSHNFATVFRNQFTGFEPGKIGQTNPLILMAHSRYANVVGNVLGTPGYHTVYEDSQAGNTVLPDKSIYLLGWSAVQGGTDSAIPYDSLVRSTLLRWGNYDYASGQARWDPNEIPAGQPVPAATLPPSLYLSARPGWWGAMPWPPVGPDVVGGQDSAGRAHRNPAQVCYNVSPKNSDGTLIFNASTCYTGGTGNPGNPAPSAPANLRIQ